jgi:hypothetical protein
MAVLADATALETLLALPDSPDPAEASGSAAVNPC